MSCRFHQANKTISVIYTLKNLFFSFQGRDNTRCADISYRSIKTDTDNLHDDDTLTPADLMTFAWQIAKGMVRAGLHAS